MEKLITDTHYRNMFETRRSGGALNAKVRCVWENILFGDAYEDADPADRCKYGCFNTNKSNHPNKFAECYGDNYLTLKLHMRQRTTCCNNDSSYLHNGSRLVGTLDNYAHILSQYEDQEIKDFVSTVCSKNPRRTHMHYKEFQVHGPLALSDFQTLVINQKHRYKENVELCDLVGKFRSFGIEVIESDGEQMKL